MRSLALSGSLVALVAIGLGSAAGCSSSAETDGTGQASGLHADLEPSSHPGMGAILYDGGVAFRVWAPAASRVFVAGDFNGWSNSANEMGNEFNGNFSTDVGGAQAWQQYKYWIVDSSGNGFYKIDPRAGRVVNSAGNGIIPNPGYYSWQNNSYSTPAFNQMVLYELHIGTFESSFGGPGTWSSAASRLSDLADLGINMIEVMPIHQFPGNTSEGYDPADLFAPASQYGTPEDAKSFVDQAHGMGIGVILDVVHNHWGPDDLPEWCIDGQCDGNGGAYFYNDSRESTPWGNDRPNYGYQPVRDYITDNINQWVGEYHFDGLRWDATKYIRTVNGDGTQTLPDGWSLMQAANANVANAYPWKIKIAEDYGDLASITTSSSSGGAGFDSQWDDQFVHPIRNAIITQNDSDRDMNAVATSIAHLYNGQATQRVIFTENHDEDSNGASRVPEMIWPGNSGAWAAKKRETLGAALVMTSPGVPMIFEGQEVNYGGFFSDSQPLDWTAETTYGGIRAMYRDLIHLRRNWSDNTTGLQGDGVQVYHVDNDNKVVAYQRWQDGNGSVVVVVANFSTNQFTNYAIGFPESGLWHVRFNSDWNGYSSDFGNAQVFDTSANSGGQDGLSYNGLVTTLPPYSVIIYSQ